MCTTLYTYEGLNVKALGWHDLANVFLGKGAQDCCLTSVVEAKDQDTGLALLFLKNTELTEKSHFYRSISKRRVQID